MVKYPPAAVAPVGVARVQGSATLKATTVAAGVVADSGPVLAGGGACEHAETAIAMAAQTSIARIPKHPFST
jgi:hypothetical protein